ncbi:hypothetical protein NL676_022790 [Syzygium grande]|nr:hypothetical protein NL676_022790 [Syzygium grande]
MERHSSAAPINPHEKAMNVPPQAYPFHRSFHSVRKAPANLSKKLTAPQPPNPTRVYKVEPINFRELMQKLTGVPSRLPPPARWLQEAAPPPLELATPNPVRGDINSNNNVVAAAAARPPLLCLLCTGS